MTRRHRRSSGFVRLTAALGVLAFVLPVDLPAASAASDRPLTAAVTAVDPLLPTAAGSISVTVELRNTTDDAIADIRAVMTASLSPLVGRSQIPAVERGEYTPTYRNADAPGAQGIDLASGNATAVTLTASPRQLGLTSSRPGVYTIGATVSGTLASGRRTTLHVQTLLPWMPRNPYRAALQVAPIWTVSAPPSLGLDGVFLSNVLARSLLPGGRLRAQLDAFAAVPNATWLVDPLTLEAIAALADGARVLQDDEPRNPTDDERAAATAWLADFRANATTAYIAALPVAHLDIRGALQDGHGAIAEAAIAQARQRVINALPGVDVALAVPVQGGSISDHTWRWLDRIGVDLVVTSDQAYTAQTQTYTPSSLLRVEAFGTNPVLVTDAALATALRSPAAETIGSDQRFASELLMTFLERPNSQRVITVNPALSWDPLLRPDSAELWQAPWLRTVTAPDAARVGEAADRTARSDKRMNLTKQRQALIARALLRQEFLTHVTSDADFHAGINDAVFALGSRWWTARAASDTYSTPVLEQLRTYTQSVQIVTQGDIVFGGERGVTPVTVANLLPVTIDVNLRANGVPSVRVTAREITPLRLNAGKRVSVEIPTSVYGSGAAYLMLRLETPDGTGVGIPTMLTVRSAAYARVASYLVAGAFVLLLMLVFVNTIRRVRVRRRGGGDGEAA